MCRQVKKHGLHQLQATVDIQVNIYVRYLREILFIVGKGCYIHQVTYSYWPHLMIVSYIELGKGHDLH